MVEKRPTPFTSPFAVAIISVLSAGFAAALIHSLWARDWNGLVAVGLGVPALVIFWLIIPSGLPVAPGRCVGGGPMFHKVDLEPGELIEFGGTVRWSSGTGAASGGYLFLTSMRLIVLPFRLGWIGKGRSFPLDEIRAAVTSRPSGWPRRWLGVLGGDALQVRTSRSVLEFGPWEGPAFVGAYPPNRSSAT